MTSTSSSRLLLQSERAADTVATCYTYPMVSSSNTFAERLRAARDARGLTQGQAAADLGCHRVTLAKWETGAHRPNGVALRAVERWIEESAKPRGGRRGS